MSQNALILNPAQLPSTIVQIMGGMTQSELSANVGAQFAVISIRGKVFRMKHGGTENPITVDFQGQPMAAPFIDVIIPRASAALAKAFYKNQFAEGSNDQPDCWSEDGVNPLAPMENRPLVNGAPCTDCRLCPMNAFGSKMSPSGKAIKACADMRKLAVVPAHDIENRAFGGPMLLRVPAASLGPLAEFDRNMQARGIPYFALVVRIGFDQDPAYPKLTFTPVRMLTEQEAQQVVALREDPRTQNVITAAQANPTPTAIPQQFDPGTGEIPGYQPTQPTAAQPAPAAAAPVAPPTPVAPQAVPEVAPSFAPPAAPAPSFAPPAAPAPSFAPPAAAPAPVAPAPQGMPNFGQPAPASFAPPAAAPAPQASFAPPAAAPAPAAPQGAPVTAPAVPQADAALLSGVDALLGM